MDLRTARHPHAAQAYAGEHQGSPLQVSFNTFYYMVSIKTYPADPFFLMNILWFLVFFVVEIFTLF